MKHRRGIGVPSLHLPYNIGSLFTRDDAIVTEQRGPFLANSVPREITLKSGYG
ncbi:MAG TPA: hypothetical protein VFX07_06805 [Candidatus Udaeobacter sp.]|jgi:hypothetical protein|nr:hypothetical protein [Candidatus Udaeobacter sp.]